jgi:hypothetical protein
LSGVAEFDDAPGQPIQTNPTAPAANTSARMTQRTVTTSRATSHSPPQSQATRAGPAGTSPISASTASAHSRRAAGSSLAERPSSPASTPVDRSITCPLPPPAPTRPARDGRTAVVQPCLFGQRRPDRGQAVGAEPAEVPPWAPGWLPVPQHASTRPRSASRIRIGYNVPDRSLVSVASR